MSVETETSQDLESYQLRLDRLTEGALRDRMEKAALIMAETGQKDLRDRFPEGVADPDTEYVEAKQEFGRCAAELERRNRANMTPLFDGEEI